MIRYALFIIGLLGWTTIVQAQNIEFKKANFSDKPKELKQAIKWIATGDQQYEEHNYKKAINFYIQANTFNPNYAKLNLRIGRCYNKIGEKNNAILFIKKAIALFAEVDNEAYFELGELYQAAMQWDLAKKALNQYATRVSDKHPDKAKLALNKIASFGIAQQLIANPIEVEIRNMDTLINSDKADYCPLISADESVLIFTSRREGTTGGGRDPIEKVLYEDIYISTLQDEKWNKAINIGEPINTKSHDATVGFSIDGQKLFIYRGDGDLYESDLEGDKWGKPERLNKNINSKYYETHASFSYDGKSIYFVSDRPDGLGGTDIWVSQIDESGEWGEASNLGRPINSKHNEDAVFMHPDGKTMYFSTDGHGTMGGYDIYRTQMDTNGTWSKPENMGYPLNTVGNDAFFVVDASGRHGYYSSTRADGLGSLDIYQVTFPVDSSTLQPAMVLMTGIIISDDTISKPVEATIEIIDNEKNEVIAEFKSNSKSGKYVVSLPSGKNYNVMVTAPGYLFHSENVDIKKIYEYQEWHKNIVLLRLKKGKKVVLNNIFFDFDKATLKSESLSELDHMITLMNENMTMNVEISGHTDNKGSHTYNKNLSTERAHSVVNYLVEQGISKSRLKYAGYAFDQPVATNDTEEGRALNRRTEFKVLEINTKEEEFMDSPTKEKLEKLEAQMSSNSLPKKYQVADNNKDGKLTSQEVIAAIDLFFEGELELKAGDIIGLIDTFFEQ